MTLKMHHISRCMQAPQRGGTPLSRVRERARPITTLTALRRRRRRLLPLSCCIVAMTITMTTSMPVFTRPAVAHVHTHAHADSQMHTDRDDTRLPDAGDVAGAYFQARRWVDAFELPPLESTAAKRTIRNASGICVLVRRHGRVIGTGIDTRNDDLMLRRAVGRALSQVLGHEVVRRLPESMRDQLGPDLVLQIEVAGPLQALPGRTFQQVSRALQPGLDGLAMQRGDEIVMRFPAQMLATNTAGRVRSLLPALAADLQITARSLEELRDNHRISVYRFRTTHLVQTDPTAFPMELFRGARPDAAHSAMLSRADVHALADTIAQHILSRRWTKQEPLGLMGDYLPLADRYEPLVAAPVEQAFAAFALSRYAHDVVAAAVHDGQDGNHINQQMKRMEALSPARAILVDLAERDPAEPEPTEELFACAMIVHAGLANELALNHQPTRAMFDRAVDRLRAGYEPNHGFVEMISVETKDGVNSVPRLLALPQQAVCAAAVLALAARQEVELPAQPAGRAAAGWRGIDLPVMLEALWSSTPQEHWPALLPWIGWAERDLAAWGHPAEAAERWQMIRERLMTIASALLATQITADEVDITSDMADLIGGFELIGRDTLDISAQSTRPAAFLAWWGQQIHADADADLDDQHAAAVRAAAHRAATFLHRLTIAEQDTWQFANPPRVIGAVRHAPWDHTLALPAQAMALLALAELHQMLGLQDMDHNDHAHPAADPVDHPAR